MLVWCIQNLFYVSVLVEFCIFVIEMSLGPLMIEFPSTSSVARFLESRGMIEEALEVATDPDYRFELAIQLGRLEVAKASPLYI